jgi:predicted phosphoribosyltransferase
VFFRDRRDAGLRLAAALKHLRGRDCVVLALPRGGVPVAYEVARVLSAPLDLVVVRKIGAPDQPELAVGAVVDGEQVELVRNEDVIAMLGIPESWIRECESRELREIERRNRVYLAGRERAAVAGKTAIVVDDGIATGATTRAALRAVKRRRPAKLLLAVPVAPSETLAELANDVDEIVCLATPSPFGAIGYFYEDFRQIEDDEVRDLLSRAAREHGSASSEAQ